MTPPHNTEQGEMPSEYGLRCGELGPGHHDFVRSSDYKALRTRLQQYEDALRELADRIERSPADPKVIAKKLRELAALATDKGQEGEAG